MIKKFIAHLLDIADNTCRSEETIAISDFERSPLRFEYEAHLEEYRALRAQIVTLIEGQLQIINFSIAAIAAVALIIQFILQSKTESIRQTLPFVFLASSLIFTLFSLVSIRLEKQVAYSANYINNVLRPRIEDLLTKTTGSPARVWAWEAFNAEKTTRVIHVLTEGWMGIANFAITIFPAIILLGIYVFNRDFTSRVSQLENALFVLAIIGIVMIITTSIYTLSLYKMKIFIS